MDPRVRPQESGTFIVATVNNSYNFSEYHLFVLFSVVETQNAETFCLPIINFKNNH